MLALSQSPANITTTATNEKSAPTTAEPVKDVAKWRWTAHERFKQQTNQKLSRKSAICFSTYVYVLVLVFLCVSMFICMSIE